MTPRGVPVRRSDPVEHESAPGPCRRGRFVFGIEFGLLSRSAPVFASYAGLKHNPTEAGFGRPPPLENSFASQVSRPSNQRHSHESESIQPKLCTVSPGTLWKCRGFPVRTSSPLDSAEQAIRRSEVGSFSPWACS